MRQTGITTPELVMIESILLPESVAILFSARSTESSYRSMTCVDTLQPLMLQQHATDERTFFGRYNSKRWGCEVVMLVDTYDQEIVGDGEIRLVKDSTGFDGVSPIVGSTITHEEYRRQGLGRRRLLSMNAAAQLLYGMPLYSSNELTSDLELPIWERLVSDGISESFTEGDRTRYRFK